MRTDRVLLLLTVFCGTVNTSLAADWPQFLGPSRTGVSAEKNLTDTFPEDGPKILWRTPLGAGMAGIAVREHTIYTLYQDDEHQYAVALDEATGKTKWKTSVAEWYKNSMGNGPRSTPAVSSDTVFVFTGDGTLAALSVKNGKLLWKVNTPGDLLSKPAEYGMASSPLLVEGLVVVHVGSETGAVAAYDAKTGERKWAAGSGAAGYSSPVLLDMIGVPQIVSFVGASVLGIDPANGRKLWEHSYITDYNCNIATPIKLTETTVLISSGESHGAAVVNLSHSGGQWGATEVWESKGKDSIFRAEWQTPVIVDGHVFGLDNVGSAGPITNLMCANAEDGELAWVEKRFGKSNLTAADGKLFLSTMRGELVIVRATPEAFEETARGIVLGMTRQAPVIANGRLYLRDDKEVVCVDIQAGS